MPRPNSTTRVIQAIGLALAQQSRSRTAAHESESRPRRFARASTSPPVNACRRAPTADGVR
ncbi:MAG: hypothetical protein K8W52_35780 [Deltaproteobacteria bacterium]|nr:hypothetical protein [Deltaproteobacteria bacterium]